MKYSVIDGTPGLSITTNRTCTWTPIASRTQARTKNLVRYRFEISLRLFMCPLCMFMHIKCYRKKGGMFSVSAIHVNLTTN